MKKLRGGYILLVTMITLTVASVILGLSLELTSSTHRNASRDVVLQQSQALAEGCVEVAFAQWKRYLDKNLDYQATNVPKGEDLTFIHDNPPDQQATLQAFFAGGNFTLNRDTYKVVALGYDSSKNFFVLTDSTKRPNVISQTSANSLVPASIYRYLATAEVTGQARGGPVTAKVSRYFELNASDLVQKAIFFEDDLEIFPGATMNILGDVHTNANLYAGYDTLGFYQKVSSVGDYNNAYKPGDSKHSGTPASPRWMGTDAQSGQLTTQVGRQEVLGDKPDNITDNVPNGIHKLIDVPGTDSDTDALKQRRLYNLADYKVLINSSSASATYVVSKNADGSSNSVTIPAKGVNVIYANPAGLKDAITLTSKIKAAVTVLDTKIKDGRQQGDVTLNTLDAGAISDAIAKYGKANNSGGNNPPDAILYTADMAYSDTAQTAVRLKNGATLSQDLTIASQNAVYINGDYNTGVAPPSDTLTAVPPTTQDVQANNAAYNSFTEGPGYNRFSAMVAADAVTVLSNGWLDANSAAATRIATPTTINSAILSGNVPTSGGNYSGGVENFPRFLENWSGITFTYYGSFIQLFASKQFAKPWGTSSYYQAPTRRWYFDMQFLTNPAPGLAKVTVKQRGAWFPQYAGRFQPVNPVMNRARRLPVVVGTLLLAVASLPTPPARALSLQPVEETFELDGVPFKHWVFTDGPSKVTYTPPPKWRLVGYPASAMLYPPEGIRGDVKIVLLPVPKDRVISKATLDGMARALRGSVPPESQDVNDLEAKLDPVPIKDVPTGEAMCAYSAFGQKFKKSVLVMNHPNYQLSFTFTASADVFDRLHKEWVGSLFSWEWQPAS